MRDFDYNQYGRQQTGFDNSIDHSLFGHWRNPEYQELCQAAEQIERENYERQEEERKANFNSDMGSIQVELDSNE